MRLIDADALLETLGQWQESAEKSRPDDVGLMAFNHGVMALAQAAVAAIPTLTLDDFGITQCKNCKYWQDNNEGYPHPECRWGCGETPDPDDYCSFGAKMGGGE